MTVTETELDGVRLLEPRVFEDERGRFLETWNAERYAEAGIPGPFVQDNVSVSKRGVVRGLHFQTPPHAQAKLVQVLEGSVYDVAVDLRRGSPTFGQHVGVELSAENGRQMYVPAGFAHGFAVTSETALFTYKCSAPYAPHHEGSLRWDDPALGIDWPVERPHLSAKDRAAPPWAAVCETTPFTFDGADVPTL
ncbi:dTDP-4-dehydrorhamnose 3,5-epimerase [Rubrivirga sp. IMCC45206]|uniref:dTDP-4-dehydrorhamnose 3,5-epimerase n=1 Tax=Rubrivirga sp. IMCC45206 TaxID=3391614 RepID=UPI0039900538